MKNKAWRVEVGHRQYKDVKFEDILKLTHEYANNGGTIVVGSDSDVHKRHCTFATAICLYGDQYKGGRYFFYKSKVKKSLFSQLFTRISEEVRRSLELVTFLQEEGIPSENIKVHVDVSPVASHTKTSPFSDALQGWVLGIGVNCDIKPDAWAASCVADRHSRK